MIYDWILRLRVISNQIPNVPGYNSHFLSFVNIYVKYIFSVQLSVYFIAAKVEF